MDPGRPGLARVSFDRVVIVWEAAYPKTYTIQVSDDGDTLDGREVRRQHPGAAEDQRERRPRLRPRRQLGLGRTAAPDARRPDGRGGADAPRHELHHDPQLGRLQQPRGVLRQLRRARPAGVERLPQRVGRWTRRTTRRTTTWPRDTVLRYRIHPCVVVWCGANEGNPPAAIDDGMRDAVQSQAPGILYQNNSAGGIITGGGPYGWVEPERYYDPIDLRQPAASASTPRSACPWCPRRESMRNLVGDEPEWPIGGAWYYHDWSTRGNQAPQNYQAAIEARLDTATGPRRLRAQGAVRQLREHPGHVRGVERQPVEGRHRPDAVDVPPGVAQHGLADLRLRLRRQRHLLRGPQGVRAGPRAGRPRRLAGHRGQPHRAARSRA